MWPHLLFSTKGCHPMIEPLARDEIHAHMRTQLQELGCTPKIITGMPDHVHLLFLNNYKLTFSEIVKQLKGNTSHWINDHDLTDWKFVWEKGFNAFSESAHALPAVLDQLRNQVEYHRTKSYLQEVEELTVQHSFVEGGNVEGGGGGVFLEAV